MDFAFALVFVYTSSVLANASDLSQWYSTKLTEEFLSFINIDFVIDQIGTPEMAEAIHGRIRALDGVRDVPIPEPGMTVISRELAEGLNIQPGGNLTMKTPLGSLTFGVSGITNLDHFAIWKKI